MKGIIGVLNAVQPLAIKAVAMVRGYYGLRSYRLAGRIDRA